MPRQNLKRLLEQAEELLASRQLERQQLVALRRSLETRIGLLETLGQDASVARLMQALSMQQHAWPTPVPSSPTPPCMEPTGNALPLAALPARHDEASAELVARLGAMSLGDAAQVYKEFLARWGRSPASHVWDDSGMLGCQARV
jgi:hypothetical protein